MNKIETFINNMKSKYPKELEDVFYNGYCYWFALILANRFKGSIWFNPEIIHFAANIDNNLYDINGLISNQKEWINWTDFQINNQNAVESIVKSCIKK